MLLLARCYKIILLLLFGVGTGLTFYTYFYPNELLQRIGAWAFGASILLYIGLIIAVILIRRSFERD